MVETFHKSSGNVFEDIGFTPAEAAELTAKSMLITAIVETIDKRKLTQKEAAHRCRTDQPTLSKVLRGRMESVTIDRLTAWLTALGRTVEIHVRPYDGCSPQSQRAIVAESCCISTGFAASGQLFPRDYRYVAMRQRFRQV